MTSANAKPLLVLAATGAMLLEASAAQAHAHLVKSNPAQDSATAPTKSLHLVFSERLEPKFSAIELMKADGAAVPVSSKAKGKAIDGTLPAPLAAGGYMVMWHVVSGDGHKIKGQYNFTVK